MGSLIFDLVETGPEAAAQLAFRFDVKTAHSEGLSAVDQEQPIDFRRNGSRLLGSGSV